MAFTRYQMRIDVDKPVEAFQQVQAHVTLCSEYERRKLKEMRDKKQHYGLLETEGPWPKRWTLTSCAVRRMKEVLGSTADGKKYGERLSGNSFRRSRLTHMCRHTQ